MTQDNNASRYMVVTRRHSARLNPGYVASMTAVSLPPPPPPVEPPQEEARPPQPIQLGPRRVSKRKSGANFSTMLKPRRSPRLNGGAVGALPPPDDQACPLETHNTSSTKSTAKVFFGKNPSWSKGKLGFKIRNILNESTVSEVAICSETDLARSPPESTATCADASVPAMSSPNIPDDMGGADGTHQSAPPTQPAST